MRALGVSELKKERFPSSITNSFNNVLGFYRRYGVGDTITAWKFEDTLIYEDHKGNRKDFLTKYDIAGIDTWLSGEPSIVLDEGFWLFHSDDNSGHTFSNIIKAIYAYKEQNLSCKVIVPVTMAAISPFILNLIEHFFKSENLIFIKPDQLVLCHTCHLYQGSWFFQYEYLNEVPANYFEEDIFSIESPSAEKFRLAPEVSFFINSIESAAIGRATDINEKICLIKYDKSGSMTTADRSFSSSVVTFFEENGFFIVRPEEYSFLELMTIIRGAKYIATSLGAISFLNKLFFRPDVNVLFLAHSGYSGEYAGGTWQIRNCYVPIARHINYLFNLNSDLTENNKIKILNMIS